MHEEHCWQFTMLRLLFVTSVSGQGIVAATALRLWLLCNWLFAIITQQQFDEMISETRGLFSLLQ